MPLIKPKEILIKDLDGVERMFKISRFPAMVGLDIIAKVPSNIATLSKQLPHLRGLVGQMCQFVAVDAPVAEGGTYELRLTTQALIDNHVPDGETLLRLLFELMRYNTSFFGNADQSILDYLVARLQKSLPKITQTLAPYLQQSSVKDSQQ